MVSATNPHGPLISVFYTGTAIFSFKKLLNYPHEAEWTPFQTHYFSAGSDGNQTRDLWICSEDL
jgi:hypothetical protein